MMDWLVKTRQRVKYEGKYNFHLFLNTQHVDSSSTISITPFTDKTRRATVPCNYIWFIIKNGLPQEVSNFKGSTFICDTSYIGYFIQAHIISNDTEYNGKAIVTFGPVQLDVSLKTDILHALSSGELELPIYLVGPQQEQKQGTIQLNDSQIKLSHKFSQLNYKFDYSILQPQISAHPREMTKATIIFNQKYELDMRKFEHQLFTRNDLTLSKHSSKMQIGKYSQQTSSSTAPKLQIKFLSRSARDTFFFTVKAFIAKKQLKNSAIVRKIQNINFEKQEQFNVILQLDNLKCDLMRYDRLYKQVMLQKKKLYEDNCRMQRQMQKISKPFEMSMNVNYSATTRRDDPLAGKNDKNNIKSSYRHKKLNDQIDTIKNSYPSAIMEPQMTLSPLSYRKEEDAESLIGILADLSHFDNQKQIDKLEKEKKVLQQKLQKSFQHINILQNKLNRPSNLPINFTYKNNQSQINQLMRNIYNLKNQNQDLRRINFDLQNDNKHLHEKLQNQSKNPSKNQSKIQSHLTKIREQNRTTDLMVQFKMQQQKSAKLRQELNSLKQQLSTKQAQLKKIMQKCLHLQRKFQDAQIQIEMYRKNQDVLNRSQHMSMQMQNYNEEQIKMLKEHNGFLVQQNQKLVKACEKYMGQAKQNNKLRQQIISLKQKINKMMTNPQGSSYI